MKNNINDLQEKLLEEEEYDEKHTHIDNGLKDRKGRVHEEYIYQDYRSVDGYTAEDGFDFSEILNRLDYEYYIDTFNKSLHKKDIDTGEWVEFIIRQKGRDLKKEWMENNDIESRELKKITDFKYVMKYINDYEREISSVLDIREETSKLAEETDELEEEVDELKEELNNLQKELDHKEEVLELKKEILSLKEEKEQKHYDVNIDIDKMTQ